MGMLDDVKSKKKQKAAENWMKMAASAKTIEKQIEYYTKALDIDPYNASAWFKKGKSLENLGRFEEAKKCFDLAIEIDPDYQGLIGKKYESKAAHEVHPEPLAEEDRSYISESSASYVVEEQEPDEQWVTETSEPAPEEEDIISQEGYSSFKAPLGDESAFSSMMQGSDENGSPESAIKEKEDYDIPVFAAVSNGVEKEHVEEEEEEDEVFTSAPATSKEESSYFRSDDNVISGTRDAVKEKPVREKPVSAVHDDIPVVSYEERPSSRPAMEKPVIPAAEVKPSKETIARPAAVASSGVGPVDIRIPLSEAIKFWVIGIVAMLIVFVLESVIQGL